MAEAGEPLAVNTAHGAGPQFSPRPAVDFGLHLPDLGEANGAVTDLETVVLRERDAVVLALAFEPGETRDIAFLYAVKERLERQVNAVYHILQDLRIHGLEFGVVFLPPGQIGLLSVSAHGDFGSVVLKLSVIDQAVVDKAAGFERGFQLTLLCPIGIQPDF